MENKEKADCLIELLKERMSKFKQTREIEFKINIALWTLIIASGYILNSIHINTMFELVLFFLFYNTASLLIIYAHKNFWMFPIQRSETLDKYLINKYQYVIENLAEYNLSKEPKDIGNIDSYDDLDPDSKNWIIFEVGITSFLLIIIGLYLLFSFNAFDIILSFYF